MSAIGSERTNAEWLDGLTRTTPDARMIEDLRAFLRGGLARALKGRSVNDADLDDFAQDGLIRALDRIESFRGDAKFTTWAMSVAIRAAYSTMRRRSWGDRSLDDLGISIAEPTSGSSQGASIDRGDLLSALRHAIDNDLTARQRALILGELAGMPGDVLVEELGTNANAMYKLYHDARKKLRASLESAGFSVEAVRSILDGASEA